MVEFIEVIESEVDESERPTIPNPPPAEEDEGETLPTFSF